MVGWYPGRVKYRAAYAANNASALGNSCMRHSSYQSIRFYKWGRLYLTPPLPPGECQSLSVTFTLRTSQLDVLGRPYMMSCKFFKYAN